MVGIWGQYHWGYLISLYRAPYASTHPTHTMHLAALIIPFAALALLFAIRGHWILYQSALHVFIAKYWALMTKQGAVTLDESTIVWPTSYMLLEVWRWDWRRYVVNQGLYDEMNTWAIQQLERTDLDFERFAAETGDILKPDRDKAPGEPGDN